MPEWLKTGGADSDVVVSTRVRLARNIAEIPFPSANTARQRASIRETVRAAAQKREGYEFIPVSELSEVKKQSLIERHLISPQAAEEDAAALIVSGDEQLSVMINEEDHIRIQAILPGFCPKEAYGRADEMDDLLSESIPYAFSEKYGYLTSCPTNTGTGLRVSVMAHLVALDMLGKTRTFVSALSRMGLTVRGTFGEGSAAEAHFYQISNEMTLGISEEEICAAITDAMQKVTAAERSARAALLSKRRLTVEDMCLRSLGILRYARRLTTDELRNYGSNIALGVSLGIIEDVDIVTAYTLMLDYTPAIMALSGNASSQKRDGARAAAVREILKRV